jgi:DNA topoisomerase-3
VPTAAQPTPSCDFKSGQDHPAAARGARADDQAAEDGKTDLLDKFVSMRTRRAFKAFLAWDAEAGKVNFEFEPRTSKFPPRKYAAGKTPAAKTAPRQLRNQERRAKQAPPPKPRQPRKPPPAKKAAEGRKTHAPGTGLKPERRTGRRDRQRPRGPHRGDQEAVGLHQGQRPAGRHQDKRAINADAKLLPVFGKAAGDDV